MVVCKWGGCPKDTWGKMKLWSLLFLQALPAVLRWWKSLWGQSLKHGVICKYLFTHPFYPTHHEPLKAQTMSYSFLCSQDTAQCLTHNTCSINDYRINNWVQLSAWPPIQGLSSPNREDYLEEMAFELSFNGKKNSMWQQEGEGCFYACGTSQTKAWSGRLKLLGCPSGN